MVKIVTTLVKGSDLAGYPAQKIEDTVEWPTETCNITNLDYAKNIDLFFFLGSNTFIAFWSLLNTSFSCFNICFLKKKNFKNEKKIIIKIDCVSII